jgi:TatD DNase family protein
MFHVKLKPSTGYAEGSRARVCSRSMTDPKPEVPVKPGATDTHCHLFMLDDPLTAVDSAKKAGVDRLICVGVDPVSSAQSLELADSVEGVFATAGMHPHDASAFDAAAGARIEELLGDPRVVGVGECGLDFFRMHSPQEDQERCLRAHIAWSNETGKPMIVHVRDAWPRIMEILDEGRAERVVIHCFSGDAEIARRCAGAGYWLSFAGNITYPKNDHLRQAVAASPAERILAETDSPFLSPQARRGRDNEPANVIATIEAIASARRISLDEAIGLTAENARSAFGLP